MYEKSMRHQDPKWIYKNNNNNNNSSPMGERALTRARIILDASELFPRRAHGLLRPVGLWLWLWLSSACLAKPVLGNLSSGDTAVEDRFSISDDRDHQNWEEEVQSLSFRQTFGWWGHFHFQTASVVRESPLAISGNIYLCCLSLFFLSFPWY